MPPIIGPNQSPPPKGSTGATKVGVPSAVARSAISSAIFSASK